MEKSDTISELSKALCAVQGKLTGAKKDSLNPFFKTTYADLASVWDACRQLLAENGLSVVQTNSPSEENTVVLDTTLLHSSGEWISGSMIVPLSKNDPQGLGSAMTYARRYGLAAIVGICPEDDDAEGATKRDAKPEPKPEAKPKPKKKDDNTLLWFKEKLEALSKASILWQPKPLLEHIKADFNVEGERISDCLKAMTPEQIAEFAITVKHGLTENKLDKSNPE